MQHAERGWAGGKEGWDGWNTRAMTRQEYYPDIETSLQGKGK